MGVQERYRIEGLVTYLRISPEHEAIVDTKDVKNIVKYSWHPDAKPHTVYVRSSTARKLTGPRHFFLHRFLLNAPDGMEVDHINGNGLDNRRANLRLATRSQNARNAAVRRDNKSGYKGVCWDKKSKKWKAAIRNGGVQIKLGYFDKPEAAYEAYCQAAKEMHKDWACTGQH